MAAGRNPQAVRATPGGFILWGGAPQDRPHEEGAFSATVDEPEAKVNHAWFRGGWLDALTMAWKDIAEGACYRAPAGHRWGASAGRHAVRSLSAPPRQRQDHRAAPGVVCRADQSAHRQRSGRAGTCRRRAARNLSALVCRPVRRHPGGDRLLARALRRAARRKPQRFSDCFYDSTLPPEVIEAVAANLTILKSPTVLRQTDGRLWAWEGCCDNAGCCHGSCTHVWNYAQAIPHLFPALERTLRETEFGPSQDEAGIRRSAAPCPSGPWNMISMPPPTASSAAS